MDNQVNTEQPQINFAVPAGVEPAPTPAEVSGEVAQPVPTPDETIQSTAQSSVYVYPTGVSVIDSGDGDVIRFEVIFNVSTYDGSNSTTSTVKKVFEISKQKLAGDMASELASAKVNVVENNETVLAKVNVTENKTDDKRLSNRMRELAGIPGKGTYV